MLHGQEAQLEARKFGFIPPVQFHNIADAHALEPEFQAQAHEKARRTARLCIEPLDRRQVQVVVVVVRDDHHIDARETWR